jgi:TldD protein
MRDELKKIVKNRQNLIELRWHRRTTHSFVATKGRVDVAHSSTTEGVGVRALVHGAFGFAATADLSPSAIEKAINQAERNAAMLAKAKKQKVALARGRLSQARYQGPGFQELVSMKLADKLDQVVRFEQALAQSSNKIHTARCRYNEIREEKAIVTSDGADCSLSLVQPELTLSAIAENNGSRATSSRGAGVVGGWNCLMKHPSMDHALEDTAQLAVDLTRARYPEGGLKTVILSPSVVGLLCHEAIGHTVEADFVKAGSVAQGRVGTSVASPLVTLVDSGKDPTYGYAAGMLPFDDEGVETEETVIIDRGILNSYLHNRETAHEFHVEPTGNARAWLYHDEPLIRMRNTYIRPGQDQLEQMIAGIDDGYFVDGSGGGQADANGEFMFSIGHLWRIENGKKTELLRESTLSGIAFDVMKTVDAVSQEFRWDLGTGYCGKGQAAKVDAGGPYIRCRILVGGHG